MPAYTKIAILALALTVIACAVSAQTVDTVVDTLFIHDTTVVFDSTVFQHTTYVLDSSTNYQKDLAELKGEFYDKALDGLQGQKDVVGWLLTLIGVIVAVVGAVSIYGGISARKERETADKELREMRSLRTEMEKLYESAKTTSSKITGKLEEVTGQARESLAPMQKKSDGEKTSGALVSGEDGQKDGKPRPAEKQPFQDRINLIKKADAQKSIDLYEELLFDMAVAGVSDIPIPSSLRRNVGFNYYRLKRWEKALKELEVYLQDSPTDGEVLFSVALSLRKCGRLEEALDYWKRTTEADPENAFAYYNWGYALDDMYDATEDKKWLGEAFQKNEKALRLEPDMHQAFYNWGISCSKMYDATKEKKWLEEAFEKYNKATEIKPDYHEAFTSWGIACGKMYGATKKKRWLVLAIEKCQRALAVAPEIRDANYNIACAYALLGESEKMLMNLKEAIDYDSKYKEMAREDDDFKAYWDDPDFIALTK